VHELAKGGLENAENWQQRRSPTESFAGAMDGCRAVEAAAALFS